MSERSQCPGLEVATTISSMTNTSRRYRHLSCFGEKKFRKRTYVSRSYSRSIFLLFFFLGNLSKSTAQQPSNSSPVNPSENGPATTAPPSIALPTKTIPPTHTPIPSFFPTPNPTGRPTVTPFPTEQPSWIPSDVPSNTPSMLPTGEPSFSTPSIGENKFRQKFSTENGRMFTPEEIVLFQGLYRSYTSNFAFLQDVTSGRIETTCEVVSQVEVIPDTATAPPGGSGRNLLNTLRRHIIRRLQIPSMFFEVDFIMTYQSLYVNVSLFPIEFQFYVNSNLEKVTQQMQLLGLNVTEAFSASRIVVRPEPSASPTMTPVPSTFPTNFPSISLAPSYFPSDTPSLAPTPIADPPGGPPTAPPTQNKPRRERITISVSVLFALLVVLVGLLVYQRKRKLLTELALQSGGNDDGNANVLVQKPVDGDGAQDISKRGPSMENVNYEHSLADVEDPAQVISPNESLVSNQSLISTGNSMAGDSGDEFDATQNLADEFDQYKDQNLEKMRADVEGNLPGFDGMMSQALTRALIDDDEANVDPAALLWGGRGDLAGAEIEASALGDVTDWLKRKGNAPVDERRQFMQGMLNKMVTSVRHNVLGPDDASRTIHECAALLGLQLATDIPVTTLIITGMRKTVTADDMVRAFSEFGEIAEAAVASNERGFGILRFKSAQSAERAMDKFRNKEVVVQDVAVQVKVLRAGSSKNGSSQLNNGQDANAAALVL